MKTRAFTLIEVIVSIAVLAIIGAIGVSSFYGARDSKNLDSITDGIEAVLQQAKADAIAGKNSASFGVAFDRNSYTYFQGTSYVSGDGSNRTSMLPGGWKISTTTSDGASFIVFNHLTGTAVSTGTVTISKVIDGATSTTRSITIGTSGDVSVIR